MKVKDLIKELQKFEPEMQIVRSGYEGGVDFIARAVAVEIALDVHTEWYYGQHEVIDSKRDEEYHRYKKTQVIHIG